MAFHIVSVPSGAAVEDEQLGTKPKYWYYEGEERWLFKESRLATGEDWAEKVAAEIATELGFPAARVELARSGDRRGSISKFFLEGDATLVHGNELLAGLVEDYDPGKKRRSDHTLDSIVKSIQRLPGTGVPDSLLRGLAKYLVLDALICNTDRHHENWGVIFRWHTIDTKHQMRISVAPSFDHASSLGRELTDADRLRRMEENRISRYVQRGRGQIFINRSDRRGANPLELVRLGTERFPGYFKRALESVASTPIQKLTAILDEVPDVLITETGRAFSKRLLEHTHSELVKLLP